jgi:O-antigen ligase
MVVFFVLQLLSKRINISRDFINITIILHCIFAFCGIWFGVNSSESISQIGDLVKITFAYLFFKEIDLKFISFEKIIDLLMVGFIVAVTIGIMDYLLLEKTRVELHSVGSVNRSAVYIAFIFVLSLCSLSAYKSKYTSYISLTALFLAGIALILGASRMAIYSLPVIFAFYLFLFQKHFNKKIFVMILILFLLILIVFIFFQDSLIVSKISAGFNDVPRIQIWISSIHIWLDNNLFFGIGVGNSIFYDVNNYFENAATSYIDNFHNVYLDMLVERGILGLITFLMFMGLLFFNKNYTDSKVPFLLPLLVFSLLLMGLANITFRYEFGLFFVTIVGAYLNKNCVK